MVISRTKKGKKMSNEVIQIQDYIDKKVDTQLSQNVDEMIMLFINKLASQGIDVSSSIVQKDVLFIIKFIDALYKRQANIESPLHKVVNEWFESNPDYFMERPNA
tara:strand:+ start:668 stop:982 length:315 start_codon:yes stop_codon:yes gene_type:complete